VIKDDPGVVMVAYCRKNHMHNDLDQVNAMALRIGLQFSKDMLFLNLIMEYSTNTINVIVDNQLTHSYMGFVLA
jgi:hypothetical protein